MIPFIIAILAPIVNSIQFNYFPNYTKLIQQKV